MIDCQSPLFPLRWKFVKDAYGRAINVTENMDTATFAVRRPSEFPTREIFENSITAVNSYIVFRRVNADVGNLRK